MTQAVNESPPSSSVAVKPQHALADALADALALQLRRVVEGAQSDLRLFASHLAADLAALPLIADAEEREASLRRTLDRARSLADTLRVRAERAAWETVSFIIEASARTLLAVAMTTP